MKFGVFMFVTDYSIGPVELAKAAEERGFDSVWVPEHTHIPTSRRTPWPGGGDLPEEYRHTMDPFVALAAIAAATRNIRIGTGICLVPQHNPICLAKRVATLDLISGGRFLFGVGAGWNEEEMENHGVQPSHRWQIMRESILAMKAIWSQEEASFHGKWIKFDPVWSWPKPVQKPHPPIVVGGNGTNVLKRVVEYGDVWMPILGREQRLEERIKELQVMAERAGRGPIPVYIFGAPARPEGLEQLAQLGVEKCIFWLRPGPAEETLPYLDRCAELARQFS